MLITVVVPTHNPHLGRLAETLVGLQAQTIDDNDWEVILVDNASAAKVELAWCQRFLSRPLRIVVEPELGLSSARRCGVLTARTDLIVFSDDDNVLAPNYLEHAVIQFSLDQKLGIAGGRSLPVHAAPVPDWYSEGMAPLGCRDLGAEKLVFTPSDFASLREYPVFAPIGAGMVFRKAAIKTWLSSVGRTGITDRKGSSLSSAGDCDMVLHALESGWSISYDPELILNHLIPANRLEASYLAKISRCAFRDFIRVLALHGIRPWNAIPAWTLPLRKIKAWFVYRPWKDPAALIRFHSIVGQYEGRAAISRF